MVLALLVYFFIKTELVPQQALLCSAISATIVTIIICPSSSLNTIQYSSGSFLKNSNEKENGHYFLVNQALFNLDRILASCNVGYREVSAVQYIILSLYPAQDSFSNFRSLLQSLECGQAVSPLLFKKKNPKDIRKCCKRKFGTCTSVGEHQLHPSPSSKDMHRSRFDKKRHHTQAMKIEYAFRSPCDGN